MQEPSFARVEPRVAPRVLPCSIQSMVERRKVN